MSRPSSEEPAVNQQACGSAEPGFPSRNVGLKPHMWMVLDYHPVYKKAFGRFLYELNNNAEVRAMFLSAFGYREETCRPLISVAWQNRLPNLVSLTGV